MDIFIQQVVSGLATGSIYAALALALVMIYEATDVVNFAQGEMAMFATYVCWALLSAGMPYWGAFFATLAIAFAGGVAIERVVIRPVENAPILTIVIITIGLLVIFNSLAGWIFSYVQKPFPSPFPKEPLRFGGIVLGAHDLGQIGVTLVVLLCIFLFFRFTPLGLAMRAAAQNPMSSRLVGIRVGWMLALGWGLAAMFGAVAGMMIAPIVFLDPNMMGGIQIYAFAAATLGGFTSPVGAVVGGLIVGRRGEPDRHLRQLHRHRAQAHGGARDDHHHARGQAERPVRPGGGAARMTPRSGTPIAIAVAVAVACVLPFVLSNFRLFQFTQVYIYAIALLGLNLLTGYNGQISLGHGAFYALGAYAAAIMMDQWQVPYGLTIPAAGVICLAAGFLFGLPALRLEGLYLALATFALALATPQILKYFEHWTGGSQGIVLAKPGAPFGLPLNPDQWLYFLTLAVLLAAVWLAANLLRGRVGRAIVALRDNHIAARAMGVNAALYKSLTFGVSAAYTGVAGALSAVAIAYVAPDSFNIFLSITLLIGIVVGGLASISGAIYGALFIQFVPNWAQDISKAAPWAIFGVFLILFMYFMPYGIAGAVRRIAARRARPRGEAPDAVPSVRNSA